MFGLRAPHTEPILLITYETLHYESELFVVWTLKAPPCSVGRSSVMKLFGTGLPPKQNVLLGWRPFLLGWRYMEVLYPRMS